MQGVGPMTEMKVESLLLALSSPTMVKNCSTLLFYFFGNNYLAIIMMHLACIQEPTYFQHRQPVNWTTGLTFDLKFNYKINLLSRVITLSV